jgi:predicted outer membrane repeat protein
VFLGGASALGAYGKSAGDRLSFTSNSASQSGGAVYLTSAAAASISGTTIQLVGNNCTGGDGGAIFVGPACSLAYSGYASEQPPQSNIAGNAASNGGGAIAAFSGASVAFAGIGSLSLANNVAVSGAGGALHVVDSSLAINSSAVAFVGNVAAFGGSAIDLGTAETSSASVHRSNVTFAKNACLSRGSTVYWVESAVAASDYSAAFGASDLTASPQKLGNSIVWGDSTNAAPYATRMATQPTALNASTPQVIQLTTYGSTLSTPPVLALVDRFGQRNVSDSHSIVTASVVAARSYCPSGNPVLSGGTIAKAANGSVAFSGMQAACAPGGNMTVQFTAALSGLGTAYDLTTTSVLSFRDCVDGETLKNAMCVPCLDGSYSLHYDANGACTPCPANSDSCSGNHIAVSSGYWRVSNQSTVFFECPYGSKACPGGLDAYGFEASRSCAKGYEGALCGVCDKAYYFKPTSLECLPCSAKGAGLSQLALLVGVPLILFCIAVLATSSHLDFKGQDTANELGLTRSARERLSPSAKQRLADDRERSDAGRIAGGDEGVFLDRLGQQTSGLCCGSANDVEAPRGPEGADAPAPTDGANAGAAALPRSSTMEVLKKWMAKANAVGLSTKIKILITVFQIITSFPDALLVHFPEATEKLWRALR